MSQQASMSMSLVSHRAQDLIVDDSKTTYAVAKRGGIGQDATSDVRGLRLGSEEE